MTNSHLPIVGNSGGLGINQARKPARSPLNLSRGVRKIIAAMKPSRNARGKEIHDKRMYREFQARLLVERLLSEMNRDLCAIVEAECNRLMRAK